MIITSTSNPSIKEIRKLKDRKYRSQSGLFFMEGMRIVIEAMGVGFIKQLIIAKELCDNGRLLEVIQKAECQNIPILEVSGDVFKSLSTKEGPQGIAAVGRQRWMEMEQITNSFSGIWIALYQVADPGNLGTILRTLDGMGGKGVILIDHCTDPYDPAAIRASMGAIFSKALLRCSSADFARWSESVHMSLVGTSDSANMDYRNYQYNKDMILLMGSEREGLPESLEKGCGAMVSIPMLGNADSLNLAVASSIILYEIASNNGLQNPKGVHQS